MPAQPPGAGAQISAYRDPRDTALVLRLTSLLALLSCLLVASVAVNFLQYFRKADLVVVDKTSGAAVVLNNRELGSTETVRLDRDQITDEDKSYTARSYAEALYRIDPATRGEDIRRALRQMIDQSAVEFAKYLSKERILETQRAESWQSTWDVQESSIDTRDAWTIQVIGTQDVTRIVNGAPSTERHQLQVRVKLAADPEGRTDRNLRTGCRVVRFEVKEIAAAPVAGA